MAKKKKNGKEFPDFSGDGKTTMKDVLMGKGVIPKPGHKKKDEDDEANEWFVDEVMSRVEESILEAEELFESILEEAEEHGVDVDYLTEEELSELFGFGMDRSTSRSRTARARMGAPKGSRRRNRAEGRAARRTRQKSQRAAMMDRLAKVSAERKAAKAKAPKTKAAAEKPKDNAVRTLATKGSGTEERSSGGALTSRAIKKRLALKKDDGSQHLPDFADSTDIVRGARLALAERVLSALNLDETFQALNMKRRAGRVDRVLKGRDKQIKKAGSRGFLSRLLRGGKHGGMEPKDPKALARAERKKKDLEARRGRGAALDRAEQERRGGGTYTKDGRRVDRALKNQRKARGEEIYKKSDVDRDDLPPSPRIQRRRAKVDAEVERKRAGQ